MEVINNFSRSTYAVFEDGMLIAFFDENDERRSLNINFELTEAGSMSDNTMTLIQYTIDELSELTTGKKLDFSKTRALANFIEIQRLDLVAWSKLYPESSLNRVDFTYDGLPINGVF